MYLVKNHHEPIISRTDFNRVQEEMARRSAKRSIAEKLTKPNRANTVQNMRCQSCLSAENAVHIIAE